MSSSLLDRPYRRLGGRYPGLFLSIELLAGFLITAGTILLLSFYYEASFADWGLVLAITLGLTGISLTVGYLSVRSRVALIRAWIEGERDSRATARAWAAAIAMPLEVARIETVSSTMLVAVPGCFIAVAILGLAWTALFPLLAASAVAVGYAMILRYLVIEAGMRPVLIDINHSLGPQERMPVRAISLRVRLLAALPLINLITGVVVAAISGENSLGVSVLIAIGVATTISLELTLLLSRSILSPLHDLQRATEELGRGNYDVSVPLTTADEIGRLSAAFNQMVAGLRERERIRAAFGTYLDEEIADYILSESYDEAGFEAEVTILFCDVLGFSEFAAAADARRVVACLNALFEVVVPIVAAEGGHVDKFEGDGMMVIFGAPGRHHHHAADAVRAGLEIDRRVNRGGEGGPFEVGVGINTGHVLAGSVGGGGRLNFSVIGDAVNVASRVEEATRSLDDSVLITAATRRRLGPGFETESRGEHQLKGIDRPIELFAPRMSLPAPAPATVSEPVVRR